MLSPHNSLALRSWMGPQYRVRHGRQRRSGKTRGHTVCDEHAGLKRELAPVHPVRDHVRALVHVEERADAVARAVTEVEPSGPQRQPRNAVYGVTARAGREFGHGEIDVACTK